MSPWRPFRNLAQVNVVNDRNATGSAVAEAVSLGDEPNVLAVVAASVQNLWEAVNNLTRLRPTKRQRYRVTVFGSARVPKSHWVYAAVRDLAAELTRMGCDIITGGGNYGWQGTPSIANLTNPFALRPGSTD